MAKSGRSRLWAAILGLFSFGACGFVNRLDGMAQANDLLRNGAPAQATILRIWDTGMTVNDDPVVGFLLEVHPTDGAPYQAETKLLVSRLQISRVQPGAVVPVRYDPVQRWRVSLEPGAPGAAAPPMPPPPLAADLAAERERLLATGIEGDVTIVRCQPLGLFDAEGRAAYDMIVTLEVPGHPPIQGPARVAVSKEHERWYHVGQRLPVRADPEALTHFAVDWSRLE